MTTVITFLFIAGYCAIMFERAFKINKAGIALLTGGRGLLDGLYHLLSG